jgi:hypothetical protein
MRELRHINQQELAMRCTATDCEGKHIVKMPRFYLVKHIQQCNEIKCTETCLQGSSYIVRNETDAGQLALQAVLLCRCFANPYVIWFDVNAAVLQMLAQTSEG